MNRIKELRTEKGLTLKDFASSFNEFTKKDRDHIKSVSYATVSRWEKGINEPKILTWKALADYFNVSVGYIQGTSEIRASSYDASDPFGDFLDNLSDLQKKDSKSYANFLRDMSPRSFYEICQVLNTSHHFNPTDVEKNKKLISSINSVRVMGDLVTDIEELFKLSLYAYNGDKKAGSALTAIQKVIYEDYLKFDLDDNEKAFAGLIADELEKD